MMAGASQETAQKGGVKMTAPIWKSMLAGLESLSEHEKTIWCAMLGGENNEGISIEAVQVFKGMSRAVSELELEPMEDAIWKAMSSGASDAVSLGMTEHGLPEFQKAVWVAMSKGGHHEGLSSAEKDIWASEGARHNTTESEKRIWEHMSRGGHNEAIPEADKVNTLYNQELFAQLPRMDEVHEGKEPGSLEPGDADKANEQAIWAAMMGGAQKGSGDKAAADKAAADKAAADKAAADKAAADKAAEQAMWAAMMGGANKAKTETTAEVKAEVKVEVKETAVKAVEGPKSPEHPRIIKLAASYLSKFVKLSLALELVAQMKPEAGITKKEYKVLA